MATAKHKDLHEAVPIMNKNLVDKQYKALQEEMKFLKERWKALKAVKELDEDDKEEKSYIATRWKNLQVEEKKLKSILDSKAAKKTQPSPTDSFAKKFAKSWKSVKEAHTFLKSIAEDEGYEHNDDKRLKSYHYGCKMGDVIADLLGNHKDASGVDSLQKLLLTTKDFPEMNKQDGEVNIHDPNGPSKYSPGDKLQQWGDGGSLAKKGKKDFPEMAHQDNEVNVTDPANPAKIAKLGEDSSYNPVEQGPSLVKGKKDFPEMGEEDGRVNVTDPAGPSHYNPGQESMQQFGQGGTLVKFLKCIHDTGLFLKSIAREKAFGITHLDMVHRLVKALDAAGKAVAMTKPFAEEHSEFPGDLGNLLQEGNETEHKNMDDDKDEDEITKDKEDKHIGGGLGGDSGGGMGDPLMGGGLEGLDDEEEEGILPGSMGEKSLNSLYHDSLRQAQDINNLTQSMNNLLARL